MGVALAALALAGSDPTPPIPWPGGRAPTSSEVDASLTEALALAGRERGEELAATQSVSEEVESAWIQQAWLDRTPLSSDLLFLLGDGFFAHAFQSAAGLGGLVPPDRIRRVHDGAAGGIDTFSCMGCHAVGGADGAGSFAQTARLRGDGVHLSSTVARNPPSLLGVGLVQQLGHELTASLQSIRARALAEAAATGAPVTLNLVAKGVSFGRLTASPAGALDLTGVAGVRHDLIVRPFGWKGEERSLRRMVEEAARVHFGAQSVLLEEAAAAAPDPHRLGRGPAHDPDQDGVLREIEEGSLTVTALYLALLEVPTIVPPADPALAHRFARGSGLLDTLRCTACHARALHLEQRLWTEHPETTEGPGITVNLLGDGEHPKGDDRVALFSDLRLHAMGDALADPHDAPDGLPRDVFLTRPLWGVADTGPWLHDGRAATLDEAIRAHGGDALAAREAYEAAPPADQRDLVLFLTTLSRAPRLRVAR